MKARGAVVGTLLVVLLLSALYPIRQYFGQRSDLRRLAAEEVELAERIRDLSELKTRLLTDEEIERIAREELGMVRPGEIAFAIVPETGAAGVEPPPVPVAPGEEDPPARAWHERWWEAVVSSITGMR